MKSCNLFSGKTWVFFFAALLLPALGSGCSGSEARKEKREPRRETRRVAIRAAAFSPDAKLLAVAFGPEFGEAIRLAQRTIQLWEVDSGKLLHTFQVDRPAETLFFGQNGKKLLACNTDQVTIFDVASGQRDAQHQLGGFPLAIMPDGKKLLLYSHIDNETDKILELWDPFTPKLLKKFSGTTYPRGGAAISPDGKWALVPCTPHRINKGTNKGPIDPTILQLWDLSKGEVKFSLVGIQKGDATSYEIWDAKGKLKTSLRASDVMNQPLAFLPDSKHVIATHHDREQGGKDKFSLRLWNITDMKPVRTVARFSDGLRLIGFSPDGKELVILDFSFSREDAKAPRFRLVQATQFHRLDIQTRKELWSVTIIPSDEGTPFFVLSSDATRLLMVNGRGARSSINDFTLEIWDAAAGKKLRALNPIAQNK